MVRYKRATLAPLLFAVAAPWRRTRRDRRGAADPWKSNMQDREILRAGRAVHCRICTILIGRGYEERRPIPLTQGRGYICWQCYASVRRQTARRAADQPAHNSAIR